MKHIAVVLAGGSGKRLGEELPKQFIKVGGRQIVEYSLQAFQEHPTIEDIILVVPDPGEEFIPLLRKRYPKILHVVPGGKERYLSSWNALQVCPQGEGLILLHDAARPFISSKIITDCLHALRTHQAVAVAVPTTDTIAEVKTHTIHSFPERSRFVQCQTPQGFRLSILRKAFEKMLSSSNPITVTDDCGVVKNFCPEVDMVWVQGAANNFKITYPEDLEQMKTLLSHLPKREPQ